jgi:hypothetical protein
MTARDIFNWLVEHITELSTVFIALFTLTLWLSTLALYKVTNRSVEAFIRSERAFCLMDRIELIAEVKDLDGSKSIPAKFRTHISNAGRTPGFVDRVDLHYIPAPKTSNVETLPTERGGAHFHGYFIGPSARVHLATHTATPVSATTRSENSGWGALSSLSGEASTFTPQSDRT